MPVSPSQAEELVTAHLGKGPWEVLPFGAGKFSETFQVEGEGGSYVLRIAPPDALLQLFYEYRMMRQEPAIHARLLAETTVPVPPIVAHDFSRQKIDRDYLILPKLSGEPFSHARLAGPGRERALREWGGYVAQIHGITDPENRFGYLGEHNCMAPQPTWEEAFAVMYRKELDDILRTGVYDAGTAGEAMKLLEENIEAFTHCKTSRLLHGDLWVTNLLVDSGGGVTGVLDFDRACWGDIEWDLAIAEYCGVTGAPFWEGYGRPVVAEDFEAAARRMFYLLYEHQKYIVISVSTRRNDRARAMRYARESLLVMEEFRRTGRPGF